MTPALAPRNIVFWRHEVMGEPASKRWHVEGSPLCVAFHLFAALPDLQRVEIVNTVNRMGIIIRIRLERRAWLWMGWRHLRAIRIARYIIKGNIAAGVLVAVHLG